MPGEWELKVFYDNDLMEAKKFAIIAEKAIAASVSLASTQRVFPKDWGLIIGVEDYAHLPRVDYARKDALVIKEYFNKILRVPEENIIYLIDSDATKARINGYLKKFISNNISKETTLYVYFAGHGAPDMQKGEPYLIPYDGDTLFIEEIYAYVNKHVTRVARRMGREQTPVISPSIADLKDISVSRVAQ